MRSPCSDVKYASGDPAIAVGLFSPRREEGTVKEGPLKIAMLSVHSCPVGELGTKDTGGMSVYIRELARELGKQGHYVDTYTRFHDLRDRQIIELGENARLIHIKAGDNGDMHKLAVYPYLTDFTSALESFRKCDGRHYDLVHSHYWLSGRVGRWLHSLWNVPHIAMFHTLGKVKNGIGVGEDEPEIRLVTERKVVKNCHRIIASTEREKGELMRYYGAFSDRIGVIPCGVNLELFKPMDGESARRQLGFSTDIPVILYVGRIDPLKGIARLLKAGVYLKNSYDFKLIIVGGNDHFQPELQKLKRLSRDLGIWGMVHFAGMVRQEELPFYYSAADVSVVPSYHESFGLVALESLACGTPVVATQVGGIENIIREGQNGYIVANDIPRSIAEKITTLITTSPPGRDLQDAIRASVTQFSWSTVAKELIQEYRDLLADQDASVDQKSAQGYYGSVFSNHRVVA